MSDQTAERTARVFQIMSTGESKDSTPKCLHQIEYTRQYRASILEKEGTPPCECTWTPRFVGSTFNDLRSRFAQYRRYHRRGEHKEKYKALYEAFDTYGVDNMKIELLEEVPASRAEMNACEEKWIKQLGLDQEANAYGFALKGNKYSTSKAYNQAYYQQNKEKIRTRSRGYYHKPGVKERRKDYYEANRDKCIAKSLEYYHRRGNTMRKAKPLVECDLCGISMRESSLKKHYNSMKHKKNKEVYEGIMARNTSTNNEEPAPVEPAPVEATPVEATPVVAAPKSGVTDDSDPFGFLEPCGVCNQPVLKEYMTKHYFMKHLEGPEAKKPEEPAPVESAN